MRERLNFASEAINWSKERLYRQIFSDEVWAYSSAHIQSDVTVKEDGSDRYSPTVYSISIQATCLDVS